MSGAPQRLRVLQVITSLAGGAGLYAVELARRLDPTRFDVLLAYGAGYPLDEVVRREQLPHRVLRWPRQIHPWRTWLGTLDVARLVMSDRFDIVHAHCSLAGAVARPLARLRRRSKVLFTVHAFAAHERQGRIRQLLLAGLERSLDGCTDHYVVSTYRYQAELVNRGIASARRIEVIPLGIDLLPAGATSRQRARAALQLADDDEVIMFSGRLEVQKGVAYLLSAWPAVAAKRPRAQLVIIGDGPLRDALVRQAAVLPRVQFAGWRDDAAALLVAADLFCLPSLWEAFGYVLLEAMAAGVPVVASRVGGVPEVLADGTWGALFPPADPPALAGALLTALADPPAARQRAERARAHVWREHDVERMVTRHTALYERIARDA